MDALDELRLRVRTIDDQILRLVRERMDVAQQIGRTKKSQGVPLRDWQVERAVLDHAEHTAGEIGLPPSLARNILQLLLEQSRARQERDAYSQYAGSAENILIIGGRGKMGRWCADFFQNQGHQVSIYDIDDPRPIEKALSGTSMAVVAVPLDATPAMIDRLTAAQYPGVAFDIASLKSHLRPSIDRTRQAGVAFTSIHPMFGPATQILSDQVICICDCGHREATQRVRGLFADTAASLVDLSLEEHDRIASYVLGLSHLLSVLFTRVLMHAGRLGQLNRVGSTTFHAQLATSGRVMHENPALYYGIQHLNAYTPQLYAHILEEWKRLTDAVSDADMQSFVRLMEEGRRWLDAG